MSKFQYRKSEKALYDLATNKKVASVPSCEWKDLEIVEKGKDFKVEKLHVDADGNPATVYTVGWVKIAVPLAGKEECKHEFVGYRQCCYCGAYENAAHEVLPFSDHPQYTVKKLSEQFEAWYFGIKNDTGNPPLAMQIFHWFSKNLSLHDVLTKNNT